MPSLYVHVPFCLRKCDYCAFYSVLFSPQQSLQYIESLKCEIILRQLEAPLGVSSLFIGGGTPTALTSSQLDELLDVIHQHFSFPQRESNSQPEKTIEVNPGTVDLEKLKVLRSYGINRISLGVQSFNPILLKRVGRIHGVKEILESINLIRKEGFNNLNLDLIFGLPGQNLSDWQGTVKQAVNMSPEHLSIYALTLEEDTPLGRKYSEHARPEDLKSQPQLPDSDLQADMYEWAVDYLEEKGYERYEISNFAKLGFTSQHNLAYWQSEPYIGLGPGAVSCLEGIRTKNVEAITEYAELLELQTRPIDISETEDLTLKQRISEHMMLGLRTTKGVNLQTFSDKFGVSIQNIYGQIMANYIDSGVMLIKDGRLMINSKYLFVANSILQHFIL